MLNECNGCEYQCNLSHIDICTLGSPCPNQRSTPMTEQEYLQTCNTEQLAEWIASVVQKAISIKEKNGIVMLESAIWWDEWLKQPHNKGDTK